MTSCLYRWGLGYQLIGELPPRDRLRCQMHACRRWTRTYCVQGDDESPDPEATARWICDRCAKEHRGQ